MNIKLKKLIKEAPQLNQRNKTLIDLNIEKYSIDDIEKKKLFQSFYAGDGICGREEGYWLWFSKYGTKKIMQPNGLELPIYWKKYLKKSEK